MSTQSFTRFSRFSRLFWIASATFSSALPRKWHSLQTWVEVRQQGGDIKQSSRKNIKCEYHGITNCNIISIYLSIYRSIYLSIRPSIYLYWEPGSSLAANLQNLKCKLKALVFPQAQHNDLGTPHSSKTRMPVDGSCNKVCIAGHSNGKTVHGPMAPSYFPRPTLRKGCLSLKWLWRRACSSPEWKLVITW